MRLTASQSTLNKVKYFEKLQEKIQNKTASVGVIGMGYVGLPNVVAKAKEGYFVVGFDIDSEKVEQINNGKSYIDDINDEEIEDLVRKGKVLATSDYSLLSRVDIILICVPTPIDEHKQPDLSYVKQASTQITRHALSGTLVILESTTYPSTTEDIIVNMVSGKGFTIGDDFFIAYSPERIDPANKKFDVVNTPRIVGGHTDNCAELAIQFIGGLATKVSSTKVAEMTKVYENTFRYINIALANELALISDKLDIDAWEVIEAASTKPYGFMPFYPTTGVGGHCIPVDPYYLSWYAKKYDHRMELIDVAGEINDRMNDFTLDKISRILNEKNQSVNNSRIAIIGAAYKKNTSDVRESPVLRLYNALEKLGANMTVYDSYIDSFVLNGAKIDIKDINYQELNRFDLVVILTDHDNLDFKEIAKNSPAILDTKNCLGDNQRYCRLYYKL